MEYNCGDRRESGQADGPVLRPHRPIWPRQHHEDPNCRNWNSRDRGTNNRRRRPPEQKPQRL